LSSTLKRLEDLVCFRKLFLGGVFAGSLVEKIVSGGLMEKLVIDTETTGGFSLLSQTISWRGFCWKLDVKDFFGRLHGKTCY